MDYPPPLVTVTANGKLSLQQSYFQSIGDFDKVRAATPHCVLYSFRCYALLSLAIPMWSSSVPSKSFLVTRDWVVLQFAAWDPLPNSEFPKFGIGFHFLLQSNIQNDLLTPLNTLHQMSRQNCETVKELSP